MQVLLNFSAFYLRYITRCSIIFYSGFLLSEPAEKFVKFVGMRGHSAEYLLHSLLTFPRDNHIDSNYCRSQ